DVPTLDQLLSSGRPGSRTAVVDGDVTLDAASLERAVGALAGSLRSSGVRRGDVVAWQLPNWWEAVALFRAAWRCGAIAAPIHHQVGPSEVGRMLDYLRPAVSLSAAGLPLGDLVPTIRVRGDDPGFDGLLTGARLGAGTARGVDLAVVLFTTGSTGDPKAVLHTHRGLAYKARSMVRAHGLTGRDTALMPSPLAHVSGLLNAVLVPGTAAMPVVLMEKWDPALGVRLAGEHAVSFMIGPPTLFLGMMDVPNMRSSTTSLRVVSCGGMGVTPEFVEDARRQLGATVKRTYGSTEAPTVTTCMVTDSPDKARDTDGRSVGEAVIKVAEPGSGRAVRPGERGEVLLRGPELFVGYGQAEQTGRAVRRGWFATGDLGTLDDAGWLTIVGRVKDVIIRAGENIASAEVERLLELHPSVRQAVVVGCPDERLGERVAAFVVGDGGIDVEECRHWFSSNGVARFKTPELVVHIDEIPLLGIGKPDRTTLRDRAAQLAGAARLAGAKR
ncbi:MAG: class I adenylate-forming enzyme family protein, partial [Acidimicrobiales bacterium]